MAAIGRVGILSDTHGVVNDDVLRCVQDCDLVLHAGDIGGAQVLQHIESRCRGRVVAVRGNNDCASKWPDDGHDALERLVESVAVALPGGTIAMEHGHRIWDTRNYHARLRTRYPDARMIVYGHTHIRVVDTTSTPWVVNPGAAGRERTKEGPSCLVVDTQSGDWSIHQYCFSKDLARTGTAY